ncbi:inorganic diphosphatase [Entomobacter blattae]|uniref:Inorganic pyrophosphatase n=1 Tax=Entomobacter blattae TaxID=2762277 RepID=A0A7H1NR00_9PROT|nr:inorganic diphosphatase [Entomobacter blattae]QNT78210.1 Inorganic pyrophosphatase [Entomobacter blattae]
MDISKIPAGENLPDDLNVVIEIPQGSSVKYEVDKASGAVFVDRFLFTPMSYPTAYGFIPQTLAADGDPADALVLVPNNVFPGSVIRARPIGVLKMEDEGGQDEKIICVPHTKITSLFSTIQTIADLPELTKNSIEHFFTHYKDLEPGKWVKITGWGTLDDAKKVIMESAAAFTK